MTRMIAALGVTLLAMTTVSPAMAQEPVPLADGKLALTPAEGWVKKMPRVNLIDLEYELPSGQEGVDAGRLTVMASGGTVEQNIDRWKSQFEDAEEAKIEKKEVGGCTVHIVDLSGTYKDQRGPFAPATSREGYRMLGAIIVTADLGNWYVKAYGPAEVIEKHAAAIRAFVDSVEVK